MQIRHENSKPGAAKGGLQQIARSLLAIAIGALAVGVIVQGESWAIREAPLLPTSAARAHSHDGDCVPDDSAEDGMLPIAVLH